ncbi:hypothetical protein D9611_012374 [Ephemerocybe angulata]|uniref:CHAT domain-containing protein n=1 Tax=Ephemerocybe angulata TaxID=980116 RepID=A0A8H5CE08_9AGAR|nr:hypothetical protein D9611_012374 [Tulosesus angulatus]
MPKNAVKVDVTGLFSSIGGTLVSIPPREHTATSGSLDLLAILQRNLKDADLAFLSACQTGTGSEKLPDEAVHLAAGMLAAGYRRVVATMWAIWDQHAPAVATDFYQYLLDHKDPTDGSGFDGSHSARALHHATQRLRTWGNDSDESLDSICSFRLLT